MEKNWHVLAYMSFRYTLPYILFGPEGPGGMKPRRNEVKDYYKILRIWRSWNIPLHLTAKSLVDSYHSLLRKWLL